MTTTDVWLLSRNCAKHLTSKYKPTLYTPHIDGGDYVVITAAQKQEVVTGYKETDVQYYATVAPRWTSDPKKCANATQSELLKKLLKRYVAKEQIASRAL